MLSFNDSLISNGVQIHESPRYTNFKENSNNINVADFFENCIKDPPIQLHQSQYSSQGLEKKKKIQLLNQNSKFSNYSRTGHYLDRIKCTKQAFNQIQKSCWNVKVKYGSFTDKRTGIDQKSEKQAPMDIVQKSGLVINDDNKNHPNRKNFHEDMIVGMKQDVRNQTLIRTILPLSQKRVDYKALEKQETAKRAGILSLKITQGKKKRNFLNKIEMFDEKSEYSQNSNKNMTTLKSEAMPSTSQNKSTGMGKDRSTDIDKIANNLLVDLGSDVIQNSMELEMGSYNSTICQRLNNSNSIKQQSAEPTKDLSQTSSTSYNKCVTPQQQANDSNSKDQSISCAEIPKSKNIEIEEIYVNIPSYNQLQLGKNSLQQISATVQNETEASTDFFNTTFFEGRQYDTCCSQMNYNNSSDESCSNSYHNSFPKRKINNNQEKSDDVNEQTGMYSTVITHNNRFRNAKNLMEVSPYCQTGHTFMKKLPQKRSRHNSVQVHSKMMLNNTVDTETSEYHEKKIQKVKKLHDINKVISKTIYSNYNTNNFQTEYNCLNDPDEFVDLKNKRKRKSIFEKTKLKIIAGHNYPVLKTHKGIEISDKIRNMTKFNLGVQNDLNFMKDPLNRFHIRNNRTDFKSTKLEWKLKNKMKG